MEPSPGAPNQGDAQTAPLRRARGWHRKARLPQRALTATLLWSAWAAFAAALVVPTMIWARRSHDAVLSAAREDVNQATASGARATENVIGLVDVFLARLSEASADGRLSSESVDKLCPSLICSNNRRASPYLIMAFTRADGQVVISSPDLPAVSLADRDYFVAQMKRDAGLYVGAPRRTPLVEGVFLPMSRRLASKDRTFDGIVAAAFNTDLIRAVFQGQGIGRLDRMRLTNSAGRPLVEWSAAADVSGQRGELACGPTASPPGPDAMASSIALPVGGLSVDACRSAANALLSWRDEVSLIAGAEALLLLTAALAVPAVRRCWESRRRQQMGLHGLVAGSSDVQFIIAAKPDGRLVLEALTFTRGGELGRMSARLIGRTTRELFAPEDVDLIEADYRSVLASGQTRRIQRQVHLGGAVFTWSTVLVPLSDEGGHDGYIYGAATEMAGMLASERASGLRHFTEDVLRREDDERRRISRELHDTTGQNLIAAGFELAAVRGGLVDAPPRVLVALAHARSLVETSVAELRTLSYVLYPALLDEAGLNGALATLAEGFGRRAGIGVNVTVAEELVEARWTPEVELALYRVAQEALTNVQRHSPSKAARVVLRRDPSEMLVLVVENGAGDGQREPSIPAPVVEGAGIRGMRDRLEALGGSLTVARQDGGIRVTATVPAGPAPS